MIEQIKEALAELPKHFTSKIEITDGCWIWKAYKHKLGYGIIRVSGQNYGAHRYSWLLFNGEIPKGLNVLHKCDVRYCVNPDHLFLGTQNDNVMDMIAKDRKSIITGENHWRSKLTQNQVDEIRIAYIKGSIGEFSTRGLARKYGVCQATIREILTNKIWKEKKHGTA